MERILSHPHEEHTRYMFNILTKDQFGSALIEIDVEAFISTENEYVVNRKCQDYVYVKWEYWSAM